jgi:AcrR family transcriptional regulator
VNLRTAQKQFTRSRLVEAAAESFRVRGYAATTIDDVVQGAGATRATFYLHFRTKADLIAEVMAHVRRDAVAFNERLESVVRAGDRASLRSWIDAAFDFWEVVRPYAVAEAEAAALDPGARQTRSVAFEAGVAAIVRGLTSRQAAGPASGRATEPAVDEGPARVRAVLAYAQLESVFHRWMLVGWDVDRAEALEVMTDMWTAALGDGSQGPGRSRA